MTQRKVTVKLATTDRPSNIDNSWSRIRQQHEEQVLAFDREKKRVKSKGSNQDADHAFHHSGDYSNGGKSRPISYTVQKKNSLKITKHPRCSTFRWEASGVKVCSNTACSPSAESCPGTLPPGTIAKPFPTPAISCPFPLGIGVGSLKSSLVGRLLLTVVYECAAIDIEEGGILKGWCQRPEEF